MPDPMTRDDLNQVTDSLRREFSSELGRVEATLGTMVGAVEKTVSAKIEGLNSGLWIKLGVAGLAQLSVVIGVVFAKPNAAANTLDFVARHLPL